VTIAGFTKQVDVDLRNPKEDGFLFSVPSG